MGLLGGTNSKESACQFRRPKRDSGFNPQLKRSPGGANGNPLQYSCLKNPIDRGAWWATVHGVANSRTQLSTHNPSLDFPGGSVVKNLPASAEDALKTQV